MTAADVDAVLAVLPTLGRRVVLNNDGVGRLPAAEWRAHLDREQSGYRTPAGLARLARLVAWLDPWTRHKTVGSGTDSYSLRPRAEKALGEPVTNGELVVAAVHAGFPFRVNGADVILGIGKRRAAAAG